MSNLSGTIKAIQNIMRKDVGVDGDAQRISQLGWMLFLKIFDDKEQDYEILDENYRSPIPEKLKWRNWAADDEGLTGDNLLDFVNNELFPTLKDLKVTSATDKANIVKNIFEGSYNYMKSGTLLKQVVNKINEGLDYTIQEERHLFNDIYEQILNDLQSAGNAGEYYTPRAITRFIVEMVDLKLGEKVLDFACGTGGFLVNVIEHIRNKGEVKTIADREILQHSILGVEKKQLPHMLATTNLILHNIEQPAIMHDNLLARSVNSWTPKERVDVIVTNPPFGGMEEDGVEKNFPMNFRTRETANLFLFLAIHVLKPNGRAGIVLPDGFLFGDGVAARLKETLFEKCNLHTIVRLPKGVFSPYTGINTNLLFFEKGQPTKEVWYFEHPYPEGVKSYNKTKPIRIEEFEPEKQWWNNRQENEYAWKVPVEDIVRNNFNLDIKNPHKPEDNHHDPTELLAQYRELQQEIARLQNELKNELRISLTD
ncbi:MAG: N-6 DNA methylase [Bacteroidales bacterium]